MIAYHQFSQAFTRLSMLLTLCRVWRVLHNPPVLQSSTTKSLALGVTLTVLLLQMAPSQAAPHHIPRQQVLYYNHVTPPQQRQSANVIIVPGTGAGYVPAFDLPDLSEASTLFFRVVTLWTCR
jgi:hypothetical protein